MTTAERELQAIGDRILAGTATPADMDRREVLRDIVRREVAASEAKTVELDLSAMVKWSRCEADVVGGEG